MYTLKLNGLFVMASGKVSEEYPSAASFDSYDDAYDFIDEKALIDRGHVELFYNYGSDDETVEDV